MDYFHKVLITNKSTLRKINLIEQIYESVAGQSVDELAEQLGVSKRTITTDIEELYIILEKEELIVKKGICFFKFQSYKRMIEVKKKILYAEPLYCIINSFYHNEIYTIYEWSARLYITEGTLVRYLNNLKILLKKHNLNLTYNPVFIVGSEIDIRYFLFIFLFGNKEFNYLDRPSEKVNEVYIKMIKYTLKNTDLHPTVKSTTIMYWIMIIEERIKHGQYVSVSNSILDEYSHSDNKKYYESLWRLWDITIIEEKKQEEIIFFSIIHRMQAYFDSEYVQGNKLGKDIDMENRLFFLELAETNLVAEKQRYSLYYAYRSYYFTIKELTKLSAIFQINSKEMNEYIINEFGSLYSKVKEIVLKYQDYFNKIGIVYLDDFIINITAIVIPFIELEDSILRIGINIEGNINIVRLINNKIELLLKKNLEGIPLSYEEVSEKKLLEMNISGIITNDDEIFYNLLGIEKIKVLKIATIPSKDDWDKIRLFF